MAFGVRRRLAGLGWSRRSSYCWTEVIEYQRLVNRQTAERYSVALCPQIRQYEEADQMGETAKQAVRDAMDTLEQRIDQLRERE